MQRDPGMNPSIGFAALRRELLERLASRVQAGIHSNIVGGPGTGKTALLLNLQHFMQTESPRKLVIAVIDPNELGDGSATQFWNTIVRATGTAVDDSREPHAAVLQVLRERNIRMLLIVHKLDELVVRPWACNASFLGTLRVFANAAGSMSERAPVSLLSTSRRTLSRIHDSIEKRLDRFPGSPPLNFMQDLPLDPATREEVLTYAQTKLVDSQKGQLGLTYNMALGHPRLTTAFIEHLIDCRRRAKPREALAQAARETLDSQEDLLRQMFAAFPAKHAFALICDVLVGFSDHAVTQSAPPPPPPAPMIAPSSRPTSLSRCEDILRLQFRNASDAHVSLARFDRELAQSLPNETHTPITIYVHAMVSALEAHGTLHEYLKFLAVGAPDYRERLVKLIEVLTRKQGAASAPIFAHARSHYVFGDAVGQLARQAVVRKDESGVVIAYIWRWWLLRQLGNYGYQLEDWLSDIGLADYADGAPLLLLRRLVAAVEPMLHEGSDQAIVRDIEADKRRK